MFTLISGDPLKQFLMKQADIVAQHEVNLSRNGTRYPTESKGTDFNTTYVLIYILASATKDSNTQVLRHDRKIIKQGLSEKYRD